MVVLRQVIAGAAKRPINYRDSCVARAVANELRERRRNRDARAYPLAANLWKGPSANGPLAEKEREREREEEESETCMCLLVCCSVRAVARG